MEVIAKNKEDYINFSIKVPIDSYLDKNGEEKDKLIELRFTDSFNFMSSSLDSLTKNLVRGEKKIIWIRGLLRAAIQPAYQKRSLSL